MRRALVAAALSLLWWRPATAVPRFDPHPWVLDLEEARTAFATKYANLEWAVFDREADLPSLFAETRRRIEKSTSETEARAAFTRLTRVLGDAHVVFRWPAPSAHRGEPAGASRPCADYDPAMAHPAVAAQVAGYTPVPGSHADVFPIGVIATGTHRVGVIRIALFEPQAFPQLCRAAAAKLSIAEDQPCDAHCHERVDDETGRALSEDFAAQLEAVGRAKPDVLLVDLTGNGGGTEWAEVAARMVTPVRLVAERGMFVRGEHWVKQLGDQVDSLREAMKTAAPADQPRLARWTEAALAKQRIAATPCDSAPLWRGEHPTCSWLGEGFSVTGIWPLADPEELRGKPWSTLAFGPAAFAYREGVWAGPLMLLVDSGTASAAEELAAELQDNGAALVVGEATMGAGCGHTNGGTPTTLSHTKTILELPDCARIRMDGTNEVRGIRPDVLVGWRRFDGPKRRAAELGAQMGEILRTVDGRQRGR